MKIESSPTGFGKARQLLVTQSDHRINRQVLHFRRSNKRVYGCTIRGFISASADCIDAALCHHAADPAGADGDWSLGAEPGWIGVRFPIRLFRRIAMRCRCISRLWFWKEDW